MDSTLVGVAKGNPSGYSWVGDTSATLPTDATTAISTDFTDLGFVSEDGVVNATEQDAEDRSDWAGNVIKITRGAFGETYAVTWLESSYTVLSTIYGSSNVTFDETTGTTTVKHNGSVDEEHAFVFESLIDSNVIMRTVIPRGTLTERGDVSQNTSDLLSYSATIKALADSSGNSSYVYIYNPDSVVESEETTETEESTEETATE